MTTAESLVPPPAWTLVALLAAEAVALPQVGADPALPSTLMAAPSKYLLVAMPPESAHERGAELEALRRVAAATVGWSCSDNQPKLGCVWPTGDPSVPLAFRTRQNLRDGWHPRIASSGLLLLAVAAATPGTVVHAMLGGRVPPTLRVRTPAGVRAMSIDEAAGTVALPCSRVDFLSAVEPAELQAPGVTR